MRNAGYKYAEGEPIIAEILPDKLEYATPHSTCPSMVCIVMIRVPMDHCLNARQSARLNIRRGLTYCLGNKASTGGAVEDMISTSETTCSMIEAMDYC